MARTRSTSLPAASPAASPRPIVAEGDLTLPGGRQVPVVFGQARFTAGDGGVLYALDLSPYRSAEAGRVRAEGLHAAVLESVHDQIAVLDGRGAIIEVNESWRRAVEVAHPARFDRVLGGDNYLFACTRAAEAGEKRRNRAPRGVAERPRRPRNALPPGIPGERRRGTGLGRGYDREAAASGGRRGDHAHRRLGPQARRAGGTQPAAATRASRARRRARPAVGRLRARAQPAAHVHPRQCRGGAETARSAATPTRRRSARSCATSSTTTCGRRR